MFHPKIRRALQSWIMAVVVLLAAPAWLLAAGPPLAVRGNDTSLRARPTEFSRQLSVLRAGQILRPLAGIDGSRQRWYFVKTEEGVQGWVLSTDVEGARELERTLRQNAHVPGRTGGAAVSSFAPTPYNNRTTEVPVDMNGGAILLPVRVNRSLETRMMMDTGATLTIITPALAGRLKLKPGSRIILATANGTIAAPVARLASLSVGSAEVRNIEVAIHDFAPSQGIEGLLGLNFLRQFKTSVDAERQVLTLKPN